MLADLAVQRSYKAVFGALHHAEPILAVLARVSIRMALQHRLMLRGVCQLLNHPGRVVEA